MPDEQRTCRKCGETKPIEEFDVRADSSGRRSECKACRRLAQRSPLPSRRIRSRYRVGTDELLECRRCGERKAWTEFPKRGGRDSDLIQSWCKACFAAYKAERHRANHEREMRRIRRNDALRAAANRAAILLHLQTHACVDCGEMDPAVLEFDHVRGVKLMDVSRMVAAGYPWARIEEEIAKCEVRCSNCHRRVTNARRRARGVAEERADYVWWVISDPGAIRTRDQQLRRLLL